MSTVFESIDLTGIRRADLRQLSAYIDSIEEEGVYWGHKGQFRERHARIKALINNAVEYAYSEGVKMPLTRKGSVEAWYERETSK